MKVVNVSKDTIDDTIQLNRAAVLRASETGDQNPLDDNSVEHPDAVILKIKISTSSPILSISNPDPNFRVLLSIRIFYSPRPDSPITISTDRSALHVNSFTRSCRLLCTTDEVKSLNLSTSLVPKFIRIETENVDLKEIVDFITIPASGSVLIEHVLPLEEMLRRSRFRVEDLKPGMRYRVQMHQRFLQNITYAYWGDLEGDLKDKGLSNRSESERDSDGSPYLVLESDWALQGPKVAVRGNVGKHGPEFELVA